MGAVKKSKKVAKSKASGGKILSSLGGMISTAKGGKSGTGRRRHHGVAYWQNRVLVTKLQKRYQKLKYGGR